MARILIIEDDTDFREGLFFLFPVTDMRWERLEQRKKE